MFVGEYHSYTAVKLKTNRRKTKGELKWKTAAPGVERESRLTTAENFMHCTSCIILNLSECSRFKVIGVLTVIYKNTLVIPWRLASAETRQGG